MKKKKRNKPLLDLPPYPSHDGDGYLSHVKVRESAPIFCMLLLNEMIIQRSLCKMTHGRHTHNYVRSVKTKEIFIPCRMFSVPSIQHWNSIISAIHLLDRMVITSHTTPHHIITSHHITTKTTQHTPSHHTLYHTTQHYITPHTILHHTTHRTTPHYITPHHTIPHTTPYNTLHHTTPHHTTHHTTPH